MRLKFIALLMLLALGAFVVAGCGDDEDGTPSTDNSSGTQQESSGDESASGDSSGSGTKLALTADPNGALSFNTDKLATKPGNVDIRLTNESSTPHDVAVEDSDGNELGKSEEVTQGDTDLALEDVKAGTYTFFCSVPGHEDAGMKGTLTVR